MALDVDPLPVRGLWFRHSRYGSEPLPGQQGPPTGSRWQRGEAVDAPYLADQASTAWTEWYRRLESLKGDRAGQHSIRINQQWRICFAWREGDAYEVEIVDYH